MNIIELQRFYCGFRIEAPVGNNAFSFDQRQCQRIYVPPLISGSLDDLVPGEEVAFSEINLFPPGEGGGLEVKAKGLKNFVHIERPMQDVFLFDNHNHAFFFWLAALEQGVIRKGAVLVHVDQHRDTREPESWLATERLGPAFDYTNEVLNVGNFIPPALQLGIFSDVVQVGSLEAFNPDLPEHFVLDIDLDIFAPVMSYIPENLKIERLRAWSRQAALVTMATSPFFIEQTVAIECAKKVLASP